MAWRCERFTSTSANLFDTAPNSGEICLHFLPSTSRTSRLLTDYLRNEHGKKLASTNTHKQDLYSGDFENPDVGPSHIYPEYLDAHERKRTTFEGPLYRIVKSEDENEEEL